MGDEMCNHTLQLNQGSEGLVKKSEIGAMVSSTQKERVQEGVFLHKRFINAFYSFFSYIKVSKLSQFK